MRTLILIDFRDFVADAVGCVLRLRQPPETVPETATLTLKHLLARWKISDIAFARTDTESWRQKQFPTYSYMRTDYVQQHWDVIQDWLTTHGFSVYFHPESEARDIIATLATQWDKNLILYSRSAYLHSLVNDRTAIMTKHSVAKSGEWETTWYLPDKLEFDYYRHIGKKVKYRYRLTDLFTLAGQNGLKGCPHIKQSRARSLIGQYCTLENIRANIFSHKFPTPIEPWKLEQIYDWLQPEIYVPQQVIHENQDTLNLTLQNTRTPPNDVFRSLSGKIICAT